MMSSTAGEAGNRKARLSTALTLWALTDGSREPVLSSIDFILGAPYSPGAAWVKCSCRAGLRPEQKKNFLARRPDFPIELHLPLDSVGALQEKIREYPANGGRLRWLLDPFDHRVSVHCSVVGCLENPLPPWAIQNSRGAFSISPVSGRRISEA